MKKIVALVLSLVMALSLCTVAFAAPKTNDKFYDKQTKADATEYVYTEATSYTPDGNNMLAYLTDSTSKKVYQIGDATGDTLYVDGNTVAEITLGDYVGKFADITYKFTATAVDAQAWSCTTDKHAAGYTYKLADGTVKYAVPKDSADGDGEAFNVLVDGKIVAVKNDKTYVPGQHVLAIPEKGAKELGVGVYEGYCAACHKTYKFAQTKVNGAGALYTDSVTMADLLNKIGGANQIALPTGYRLLNNPFYIVGETTNPTPAKDGVTSAKTFDAGVAMYVGMSLLSVAGGAVVIGKKKEF